MASALAMMLGGAITNAFAFSGSNYLFSHMGGKANEEKIRHDKAIEKLEKAQAEWNKKTRGSQEPVSLTWHFIQLNAIYFIQHITILLPL